MITCPRILRALLLAASVAGLLVVAVAYAGGLWWWADLPAQLRPQFCVALALLLVAAVFLRQRLAAFLALVAWLINAAALAPFIRSWATPEMAAERVQVWSFASINLLQGNREPDRVVRYVAATAPEVVVFQEVSDRLARELEPLHPRYAFRYVAPSKDQFGLALFSTREPAEVRVETLGLRPNDIAILARWAQPGGGVAVAVVHPDKPDAQWKTVNRAQFLDRLATWVEARRSAGDRVVVLGDFNATPWSHSLRSFVGRTGLRNANDGQPFAATWNVWQPHRLLIDHALFSPEWRLHRCEVGPDVGSDHRPLLVRASLPGDASAR